MREFNLSCERRYIYGLYYLHINYRYITITNLLLHLVAQKSELVIQYLPLFGYLVIKIA